MQAKSIKHQLECKTGKHKQKAIKSFFLNKPKFNKC